MSIVVKGDLYGDLERLKLLAPRMMSAFAEEEGQALADHIRKYTPRDTGMLQESIQPLPVKHVPGTHLWRTGAGSELWYASYVNDGTPPHIIRAQEGALEFQGVSTKIFRKEVKHPGTPAFRMFQKGAFVYRRFTRQRFHPVFLKWKAEAGFFGRKSPFNV